MSWGPPIPLDHEGTTVAVSDAKVEIRHAPSRTRMGAGVVLVAVGPLAVAVPVLLGLDVNLFVSMLAAAALMVAGLVLAMVRAQIVVTEESLFRWGGLGRPKPEIVGTESPEVIRRTRTSEAGPVHVVQVRDRGEVLDVAESLDEARAREIGEALADVLDGEDA